MAKKSIPLPPARATTPAGRTLEDAMNKVARNFERVASILENEIQQAAVDEAFAIIEEAQRRVPVDTGALRESGFVQAPRNTTRGNVTVNFGFSQPYAKIQHDTLWYRHRVGEALYLKKAVVLRGVIFKSVLSERTERQMRAQLDTRIRATVFV